MATLKVSLCLACDLPAEFRNMVGKLDSRHLTSQQVEDMHAADVYIVVDTGLSQVMKAPNGLSGPTLSTTYRKREIDMLGIYLTNPEHKLWRNDL